MNSPLAPTIHLTDTPAHFAPLFTAATNHAIRHVDGYIADKDPQTGKPVRLGISSWQDSNQLLVATVQELPHAYAPAAQCLRVMLYSRRERLQRMQQILFAFPTLMAFVAKGRTLTEKLAPDKDGFRRLEWEPGVFVQTTNRPGDRVFNPFLKPTALTQLPPTLNRLVLARLLLTGAFEDLREHRCLRADTRPDPFWLARALIEHAPTIIGRDGDRIVFTCGGYPTAQFSGEPSFPDPQMAPPAPATQNCAHFL